VPFRTGSSPDRNSEPFHLRFEIVKPLGGGASGTVYAARDRETGRSLAVKTLPVMTSRCLEHFEGELRAFRSLCHPGVVELGDLFTDGEPWFFTMELVDGVDWLSWGRGEAGPTVGDPTSPVWPPPAAEPADRRAPFRLPAAPPDVHRLRRSLIAIVDALASIHAAGLVHGDVKPSNVLVTGTGRVVLVDLVSPSREADGVLERIAGTPAYMAPEAPLFTPAIDLYALGVMLYEALTGTLPFQGTAQEILHAKRIAPAPPVARIVQDAPADLGKLAERLLSIEPAHRPTAEELLRRVASPPIG
jgi:eukaryotic-like serine/threonine-protein kinase